jgi:hypothetical protein
MDELLVRDPLRNRRTKSRIPACPQSFFTRQLRGERSLFVQNSCACKLCSFFFTAKQRKPRYSGHHQQSTNDLWHGHHNSQRQICQYGCENRIKVQKNTGSCRPDLFDSYVPKDGSNYRTPEHGIAKEGSRT